MSNDALNAVIRRPGAELHTENIGRPQPPTIETRGDLEKDIVVSPGDVKKNYLDAIAMAEEPVTIRIERSSEKNAPPMIDCWVNGEGAEVLVARGQWVKLGFLPVGRVVTTKRKYVEVLVKSKTTTVNTKHDDATVDNPVNTIERYDSSHAPLSIIRDDNPLSGEWFARLMNQR